MSKNMFYQPLPWYTPFRDQDKLSCDLDVKRFHIHGMEVAPIDDDVLYDLARYDLPVRPGARFVFYVQWENGEYQPRETYTSLDEAQKDIDEWWRDYTRKLSEGKSQ